jgi:hypothetical protein
MIALDSAAGFVRTLATAHRIALTAYTLSRGAVLDGLVDAARRGADVRVRIERDPMDDAAGTLHAANAAAVARLREAGATAEETAPGEPVLHLKAAVVDGVAWLDDRNWATTGAARVLRDTDPGDVAVVAAAVAGGPGADDHLATTKAGAQQLEGDTIARAGAAPLAVESESFGNGPIYNALLHRAQAHLPTRLIVNGGEAAATGSRTERAHLAHLAVLGVEIRAGNLAEKLAVSATEAWVGSANATYARGPAGEQRDWGMATREPAIADGLRAAFERNWNAAHPFTASP